MPVSDAKRRANDKWDKENMATLVCKVKRPEAERFKEKAKASGETANSILAKFVREYINSSGEESDGE